jgi:hypothetical protein
MFIRSKVVKGHTYYQMVRGDRDPETGKVRQTIVLALGRHPTVDAFVVGTTKDLRRARAALERERAFWPDEMNRPARSRKAVQSLTRHVDRLADRLRVAKLYVGQVDTTPAAMTMETHTPENEVLPTMVPDTGGALLVIGPPGMLGFVQQSTVEGFYYVTCLVRGEVVASCKAVWFEAIASVLKECGGLKTLRRVRWHNVPDLSSPHPENPWLVDPVGAMTALAQKAAV